MAQEILDNENDKANTTYILNRLREYEAAHDTSVGMLMRRISLLENDVKDLQAKHGALVALVYSKKPI